MIFRSSCIRTELWACFNTQWISSQKIPDENNCTPPQVHFSRHGGLTLQRFKNWKNSNISPIFFKQLGLPFTLSGTFCHYLQFFNFSISPFTRRVERCPPTWVLGLLEGPCLCRVLPATGREQKHDRSGDLRGPCWEPLVKWISSACRTLGDMSICHNISWISGYTLQIFFTHLNVERNAKVWIIEGPTPWL